MLKLAPFAAAAVLAAVGALIYGWRRLEERVALKAVRADRRDLARGYVALKRDRTGKLIAFPGSGPRSASIERRRVERSR